jgi:hypothetical protein
MQKASRAVAHHFSRRTIIATWLASSRTMENMCRPRTKTEELQVFAIFWPLDNIDIIANPFTNWSIR